MKKVKVKSMLNKSATFVLLKDVGGHDKGDVFDSQNGLIPGITVTVDGKDKEIYFYDSTYFKLYNKKLHN